MESTNAVEEAWTYLQSNPGATLPPELYRRITTEGLTMVMQVLEASRAQRAGELDYLAKLPPEGLPKRLMQVVRELVRRDRALRKRSR
ncbi:MAG: hypothetical protein ACRELY_16995 [Polyangiaceae bacterium]